MFFGFAGVCAHVACRAVRSAEAKATAVTRQLETAVAHERERAAKGAAALDAQVAQLQARVSMAEGEAAALREQIRVRDGGLARLRDDASRAIALDSVAPQLASLDATRAKVAVLEAELAAALSMAHSADETRKSGAAELERVQSDLTAARARVAAIEGERDVMAQRLEAQQGKAEAVLSELNALADQLAAQKRERDEIAERAAVMQVERDAVLERSASAAVVVAAAGTDEDAAADMASYRQLVGAVETAQSGALRCSLVVAPV